MHWDWQQRERQAKRALALLPFAGIVLMGGATPDVCPRLLNSAAAGEIAGSAAAANDSSPSPWIDPAGIRGQLLLTGAGPPTDATVRRFQELAGDQPRLVVVVAHPEHSGADTLDGELAAWRDRGFAHVELLPLPAPDAAEVQDTAEVLARATAVWIAARPEGQREPGGPIDRLLKELGKLLERGGIVAGGAGALALGEPPQGELLPGCCAFADGDPADRAQALATALAAHPDHLGIELLPGAAILVQGRSVEVLGAHEVRFHWAAHGEHAAARQVAKAGERLDLIALRRAARQRLQPVFPPARPQPTRVAHGSLVLVGGGRLPDSVLQKFLELAGGRQAPIVVLPTALPDPLPDADHSVFALRRAGAEDVTVLTGRTRDEVESEAFVAALRRARGVWFGGGRQWRFVDAYEGTVAEKLLHEVLERGGVIGGSSAGASIQAEYLVRGNPLGNQDMMALGYERGLGFLPGAAVDQHFTERDRFQDLARVVDRYPQLLGIGIDEATALVVEGSTGSVLGEGAVHFFDHRRTAATGELYVSVPAGSAYELELRRPIERATAPNEMP